MIEGGDPTSSGGEGARPPSATKRDEGPVRSGRRCTVCAHPEADDLLLSGGSYQAVADRFGLTKAAVGRHVRSHLTPAAVRLADSERSPDLVGKVEGLLEDVEAVLDAAKEKGQGGAMLAAIREARPTIELLARLTGALRGEGTNVTINVATSDEWRRIRSVLTEALVPYPAAAAAVSAALLAVEGDGHPSPRPALPVASTTILSGAEGGA